MNPLGSAALHRLGGILSRVSVEDLPAAFEAARKLSSSEHWQVLTALGNRWAEFDPRAAVEFAVKNGKSVSYDGANYLLEGAVAKWANLAPAAAIAWAKSLPPGMERNDMLGTLITVIAHTDPGAALSLRAIPPPRALGSMPIRKSRLSKRAASSMETKRLSSQ